MTKNKKKKILGVGLIAAIGLLAFALAFAASGSGGGVSYGLQGWSLNNIGLLGISGPSYSPPAGMHGVHGVSETGVGVYGEGGHTGIYGNGSNDGVKGESIDGNAVHGLSTNGYGVLGESVNSAGVKGHSDTNYGVSGQTGATTKSGVYGRSDKGKGVEGFTTSNNEWVPAIYGRNEGAGDGLYGWSQNRHGVYGVTNRADHKYGVYAGDDYMYAARYDADGADVAEYFPAPEDPEPGTVMTIDPAGGSKLRSSTNAYDTTVAGIVSTAPGVSLGTNETGNDGEKLIAVAGRVPCKVDASYAAIMPGDLLTTSDTPGHAMKAQPVVIGGVEIYRSGTTLGKALEPLDSGTGVIEVLVTLQ